MKKLVKKINFPNGECTYDFSSESVHEFMTDHNKGVRALFERVYEYQEQEEKIALALKNIKTQLEDSLGIFPTDEEINSLKSTLFVIDEEFRKIGVVANEKK